MKKTFIGMLVLTSMGVSAQETTYIKNHQLCIKHVCVGDDIRDLKTIKFKPARIDFGDGRLVTQMPVTKEVTSKFIKQYMSPTTKTINPELVQYGLQRKFDNRIIDALTKEKGVCTSFGDLTGEFITDSGLPTTITVDLRINKTYTEQTWRVTVIRQQHAYASTFEERKKLQSVFEQRYKQADLKLPFIGVNYQGDDLVLSEITKEFLPGYKVTDSNESEADKLKKYPGCETKMILD